MLYMPCCILIMNKNDLKIEKLKKKFYAHSISVLITELQDMQICFLLFDRVWLDKLSHK